MTFKSIAAITSVKGIKASTCRLGRWLTGDGHEGKDKKINKKKMGYLVPGSSFVLKVSIGVAKI
ncbi:unnamed protein product [Bathycoccus prasinos]